MRLGAFILFCSEYPMIDIVRYSPAVRLYHEFRDRTSAAVETEFWYIFKLISHYH